MKLELEIQCPECGGAVLWTESQITGTCEFCGSLLFFEPDIEHYFYLPPVVCTDEQVRQCIILSKAEKKRAETVAELSPPVDDNTPGGVNRIDLPLAPFVRKYESKVTLLETRLIYVPYWHFQATLIQCLLAENPHGVKEYHFRRAEVDQAVPAYDTDTWNFRDRGLRFKDAHLKEANQELLSGHTHLPFMLDLITPDTILRGHPPIESNSTYTFKKDLFCDQRKFPVLRPCWVARFHCDKEEVVLVDGCFSTIAGYPAAHEAPAFLEYRETPLAASTKPALKVLTTRCPDCGADTKWGNEERIHFCENCGRALVLRSAAIQIQPYEYSLAKNECTYVPFWRFRVTLSHQNREFKQLREYYKLFFQDRQLKDRVFSDSLFIPAVPIRNAKKGDQLLSALLADAAGNQREFLQGPAQSLPIVSAGSLDVIAASEVLHSVLPSASGIPATLHKSGVLTKMLKETSIRFDQAMLALLAYERRGSDILIQGKPYPLALLQEK